MKTLITNWIHAHLEYITGGASGAVVFFTNIPDTIIKAVLALIFGFLGAAGAGIYKWLEKKLKRK